MARKRRRKNKSNGILIILILLLAAVLGFLVWLLLGLMNREPVQAPTAPTAAAISAPTAAETAETTEATETIPPETTLPPEPEHVVSTATILSTGDLLMHSQLIKDARQSDGSYDFSYIFPYVTEYAAAADFAVANLETTLAGSAKPYQGNPMFNCPDAIVDAAKDAGFDLLLTANNHSYDSQQPGFERTLNVIREKGLITLGTMLNAEEPKYTVQEINGIRIGMICYTYEDSLESTSPPALNYNPMNSNGYDLINCFRHTDPEPFYQEMETRIAEMKEDGAEAIVAYMHWAKKEYILSPNSDETQMAQRLCDLGVDVIIGGHPHVVQPAELLTSRTDPSHRTVCLYSMGNAVSNQRYGKINSIDSAHTEDGVLFYLTFSKYSDGTVYLESSDLIPTWVRAIDANGKTVVKDSATIVRYEILPLDNTRRAEWAESFGLDESTLSQAEASWQRTDDLTGSGMAQIKEYLSSEKTAREDHYLALVQPAA